LLLKREYFEYIQLQADNENNFIGTVRCIDEVLSFTHVVNNIEGKLAVNFSSIEVNIIA